MIVFQLRAGSSRKCEQKYEIANTLLEDFVDTRMTRKRFLSGAARYLTAAVAGTTVFHVLDKETPAASADTPAWPWPYAKLDPEEVRKLGHDAYYESGCGYAGFSGIVKALQAKTGAPFTSFPLQMMSYGSGGLKGWGTVCGALNGASAAISLVTDTRTSSALIDELINWYTQTMLPSDISNHYAEEHSFKTDRKIPALPQNISGSPLCHVSVSKWCLASGRAVDSPDRMERCARLSGDVVAQAVKLLNDQSGGAFHAEHTAPKAVGDCMSCHGGGHSEKNVSAKMDCLQCHHQAMKCPGFPK